MVSDKISVVKSDGRTESLDIRKIQKITQEACEGLHGVSASQVEMNSGILSGDPISLSIFNAASFAPP